jgi:hypothetical protein
VASASAVRVVLGVLVPLHEEDPHGVDLGLLFDRYLFRDRNDFGVCRALGHHGRQVDRLLMVRDHVRHEREVVGVEAGGLTGDDGLVGLWVVVVAFGTATRGQDQRGDECDEDGDDTTDAGGHDTTVPHTPPGYE